MKYSDNFQCGKQSASFMAALFLLMLMFSSAANAALLTYTGTFNLNSGLLGEFNGTWSFTAEETSLNLSPYQQLNITLDSFSYNYGSDPFVSTVFDTTNSSALLRASYNGSLYLEVYGNPNGRTISYGSGWSADDFSLTYYFGWSNNDLIMAHLSADGTSSFHNYISLKSGTITSSPAAVPIPAAVWLFGSGLLGLIGYSRRRVAA